MKATYLISKRGVLIDSNQHKDMISEAQEMYSPIYTEAQVKTMILSAMAKQREAIGKLVSPKYDLKAFPLVDVTLEEL